MELISQKWTEILTQLESEFGISEASMIAWHIADLKLYKLENNIAYFIVPDKVKQLAHRYDDKFGTPLLVSIIEATSQIIDSVKFVTSDDVKLEEKETAMKEKENNPKPPAAAKSSSIHSSLYDELNPKYTFDTYVVGDNNRLAYSSCLAVAESPGEQYNPLFIYGGPGLGKTHLMNAIARFIIENIPDKKILFVNTNDFVNEIIYTIQNTNKSNVTKFMENLREKYDRLDVLLIDDIQFIIGKEHTQEEFFHIFNSLYESGKQIIISSDRPPRELKTLEERLVSRFNMGVTTDISSPTYETRRAILAKKNQLGRYHMDEDILDYIAKNISTNVRELEGALNKLVAFSSLYNKKVTLSDAEHELRHLISPNHPVEITPDFIIQIVAEYYNLTADALISSRRSKNLVRPRHIAMYLCRQHTQLSFKEIGEAFGGRDYSTCINGVNKIENEYLNQTEDTRTVIDILTKKITPADIS